MLATNKDLPNAVYGCRNAQCSEEFSYPSDMLYWHPGNDEIESGFYCQTSCWCYDLRFDMDGRGESLEEAKDRLALDTGEVIKFHSGTPEYGWLSNFHPSPFTSLDVRDWRSVEHFYQAWKTLIPSERERVRAAESPYEAKQLGRKIQLRHDWEEVKERVMYLGLFYKFQPGSEMGIKLIETHPRRLVHETPWGKHGDPIWGEGRDGKGRNLLGKLIERMRTSIMAAD